jgi:hypothetical protein
MVRHTSEASRTPEAERTDGVTGGRDETLDGFWWRRNNRMSLLTYPFGTARSSLFNSTNVLNLVRKYVVFWLYENHKNMALNNHYKFVFVLHFAFMYRSQI